MTTGGLQLRRHQFVKFRRNDEDNTTVFRRGHSVKRPGRSTAIISGDHFHIVDGQVAFEHKEFFGVAMFVRRKARAGLHTEERGAVFANAVDE